jgi:F0F1-type ATP synthase membrane subunit b/b'
MSRAYRIRVRESIHRVLKAYDKVSTQLEILEILPPEPTAALLEQALLGRGFQKHGEVLVRQQKGGVTVTVDPRNGTVNVQAEASAKLDLEAEKEGRAYDDVGPHAKEVKKALKEDLQKSLTRQADEKSAQLQNQVTDRLEGELRDLRQELDQVVNKVTAEALKQKAAQLGQIKRMTEDPQTGSLTIVLEV